MVRTYFGSLNYLPRHLTDAEFYFLDLSHQFLMAALPSDLLKNFYDHAI